MPWSANYRKDEIEKYEVVCTMALITAAGKKETPPASVQFATVGSQPLDTGGACQSAFDRLKCTCEGFVPCIGQREHLRRPHQCYTEPMDPFSQKHNGNKIEKHFGNCVGAGTSIQRGSGSSHAAAAQSMMAIDDITTAGDHGDGRLIPP